MARKKVPENETPRQKFVRLANYRSAKAIQFILSIGSLANSQYKYTEDDVEVITTALSDATEALLNRFANPTMPKQARNLIQV